MRRYRGYASLQRNYASLHWPYFLTGGYARKNLFGWATMHWKVSLTHIIKIMIWPQYANMAPMTDAPDNPEKRYNYWYSVLREYYV